MPEPNAEIVIYLEKILVIFHQDKIGKKEMFFLYILSYQGALSVKFRFALFCHNILGTFRQIKTKHVSTLFRGEL
jgi:hypothetical protein